MHSADRSIRASIRSPTPAEPELGRFVVGWVLAAVCLVLAGCRDEPPRPVEAGTRWSSIDDWREAFSEVEDHPLLERIDDVFPAVRDAVGVGAYAELYVFEMGRSPRALALPDGSILLSRSGLELCYERATRDVGDSRLAFLLGHELSHVASNDFWHASAFAAVRDVENEDERLERLRELLARAGTNRSVLELKADHAGILAALQAGYDPSHVIEENRSFFEEWTGGAEGTLAYGDSSHPLPGDRASYLKIELAKMAGAIHLFDEGVAALERAKELASEPGNGPRARSRYEDAIRRFDEFRLYFSGREVLNNLAVAHLRIAAGELAACDGLLVNRYYLPTVIDHSTLADRRVERGPGGHSSPCFDEEPYREHMQRAVQWLEEAAKRDPEYLPARLNLVAAHVLDESEARAQLRASEAVTIAPDDPRALNAEAVAKLLAVELGDRWVGEETPITGLTELHRRFPEDRAIAFNLASGLSYRGRLDEARPVWRDFLELEPEGAWAEIARGWLGGDEIGRDQLARR